MIYLDNSATTKPDPAVLQSFHQVAESFFANPSSIHQFGGKAETLLQKSKEQASTLLGVSAEEIIFTSGGTEGNNLAIKGFATKHQNRGKHIITTEIEHPSVYQVCQSLEEEDGFRVTYLPADENGRISIEDLKNAIQEDTILISIMHVNNEIGSIQPVREIGEIAKKYPKLALHVDHVQGMGKVPLQLDESGIDLCTISGHKIHGLKGTGILYVNQRTNLLPLFHGGNQERSLRSGTENLAGSVSLVKAMRLIREREADGIEHMYKLRKILAKRLGVMNGVIINSAAEAAPHIMNISVPGIKPEVIIHMLGEKDIFISTKSACSSRQSDESKTLAACGFDLERSTSALRISMSFDTTESEIEQFLQTLEEAINKFKAVMR
ncbi:cysteine desulfurase family protein [Virgibacillus siamensis]|uniref:Cysteine desulfurase family protein n=1 Tax=Virgibacillus siamensis TaxID=480071 RepID=A0ABN1FYW2_9BACI